MYTHTGGHDPCVGDKRDREAATATSSSSSSSSMMMMTISAGGGGSRSSKEEEEDDAKRREQMEIGEMLGDGDVPTSSSAAAASPPLPTPVEMIELIAKWRGEEMSLGALPMTCTLATIKVGR